MVNTNTGASNLKSGAIINTYDVIAIRTQTEKIFKQMVEKADVSPSEMTDRSI